jgi:hypothetical protein
MGPFISSDRVSHLTSMDCNPSTYGLLCSWDHRYVPLHPASVEHFLKAMLSNIFLPIFFCLNTAPSPILRVPVTAQSFCDSPCPGRTLYPNSACRHGDIGMTTSMITCILHHCWYSVEDIFPLAFLSSESWMSVNCPKDCPLLSLRNPKDQVFLNLPMDL